MNFPDIQLLLENKNRRDIPVMIEAKGARNKLEKLTIAGVVKFRDREIAAARQAVNA